jgi:hypothetical protein
VETLGADFRFLQVGSVWRLGIVNDKVGIDDTEVLLFGGDGRYATAGTASEGGTATHLVLESGSASAVTNGTGGDLTIKVGRKLGTGTDGDLIITYAPPTGGGSDDILVRNSTTGVVGIVASSGVGSSWTDKSADIYRNSKVGIGDFSSAGIDSDLHLIANNPILRFESTNSGSPSGGINWYENANYIGGVFYSGLTAGGVWLQSSKGPLQFAADNSTGTSTASNSMFVHANASYACTTISDGSVMGAGIDQSGNAALYVNINSSGAPIAIFDSTDNSSINGVIRVLADTTQDAGIQFGDDVDVNYGRIMYDNSAHDLLFYTQNTKRMTLDDSGLRLENSDYLHLGTTSGTDMRLGYNGSSVVFSI